MKKENRSLQTEASELESVYFKLQAAWGITKHLGGAEATTELADACRVGRETNLLYVGSGVGISPCYLVKKYGCRLTGIDISEEMVARSRERAKKEEIEDRTEFRVADAQELPFEDGTFNAVFCESVLAFVPDRQEAVNEFARVTVPGGYAGYNEVTWLETPPPDMAAYMYRIMGAEFLTDGKWRAFLEGAGLEEIKVTPHKTNIWSQWAAEVGQFSLTDSLKAWGSYGHLFFTSPACRRFTREAMAFPKSIFHLFKYFGYGIYTGRKR